MVLCVHSKYLQMSIKNALQLLQLSASPLESKPSSTTRLYDSTVSLSHSDWNDTLASTMPSLDSFFKTFSLLLFTAVLWKGPFIFLASFLARKVANFEMLPITLCYAQGNTRWSIYSNQESLQALTYKGQKTLSMRLTQRNLVFAYLTYHRLRFLSLSL